MKIRKLLKFLLGAAGLRFGVVEGDGGGASAPLDAAGAASAFESLLGGEPDGGQQAAPGANDGAGAAGAETDEQAAERLVREEAEAAGKPEGDGTGEPQAITIKVDGKDVTLTPAEMAEHVKNGMRQQDYTQKTMVLAEQRKAADTEAAQARAQRDQYAAKLEGFANHANYELHALSEQLTDELLQTDPVEYLTKQRTLQTRQAELVQAQQELQQINGQRQKEQADALKSHLDQQREQLLAKLPDWKDSAKADAESAQIKKYLAGEGFAAEEMSFTDHRAIVLARKAMLFDSLMERAKGAVKKVSTLPPKVERPGNAETQPRMGDGRTAAMKRLGTTGSINDAAAAFAQSL